MRLIKSPAARRNFAAVSFILTFCGGTTGFIGIFIIIKRNGENKMWDCFKDVSLKHGGIFSAGVLFGTAGIKILSSKDARKVYTKCTAAALRAKDCIMEVVTKIQENAEDILEEAKEMNEAAMAEEEFDDAESIEDAEIAVG